MDVDIRGSVSIVLARLSLRMSLFCWGPWKHVISNTNTHAFLKTEFEVNVSFIFCAE